MRATSMMSMPMPRIIDLTIYDLRLMRKKTRRNVGWIKMKSMNWFKIETNKKAKKAHIIMLALRTKVWKRLSIKLKR